MRDIEAKKSKLEVLTADLQGKLKAEGDKTKKIQELEKIIADLKKERDLLSKHI